jgi:hypothetical protein
MLLYWVGRPLRLHFVGIFFVAAGGTPAVRWVGGPSSSVACGDFFLRRMQAGRLRYLVN